LTVPKARRYRPRSNVEDAAVCGGRSEICVFSLGRTGTISSMSAVSILDRRVTVETDGREPGVICTNTNGDCSTGGGGSIAIIVSDGAIVDEFVSMSIFSGSFSIELIRTTGFSASALTDSVFHFRQKPVQRQ
jgi:hypothetical protein